MNGLTSTNSTTTLDCTRSWMLALRYEREMARLGAQLRQKREAVRNAERDLDAMKRGYLDPAAMGAPPDPASLQKECQRIEVGGQGDA